MADSHRIEWIRTSVPTCRRSRLCAVFSALFLAGLLQITSGCAAARLTQFHNFAQAGTAYTKASQAVLDEAGTAAIEADSLIAQKGRDGLRTPEERRQYINGNNQELRKRLALLETSDAMGGCCNRTSRRSQRLPILRPPRHWERQLKAYSI